MSPEEPRRLSLDEAWETSTVFFIDEDLEDELDREVEALVETGEDPRVSPPAVMDTAEIAGFLAEKANGLDLILKDIALSEEKFKRIVSLMRKLGLIPGGLDSEWSMDFIKRKITEEPAFAKLIANLLLDGHENPALKDHIPRYYLEKLNYREINGSSAEKRRILFKERLIGTYGGRKGTKVEGVIEGMLLYIKRQYGIPYEKRVRVDIIDTTADFVIPNREDPWVIIMSSFQETTSSGQSTKRRDMLNAYQAVERVNSRNRENRAFVNLVDGGGWLARKPDFQRLVSDCHYFINLHHLGMLEAIILKHVPEEYFRR